MDNRPPGEIDLLELFASFFLALKRNWVASILLPTAGIAIAIALALQSKDKYASTLLIETSLLSENECKFLFTQLDKVGAIPGMTPEQYREVIGFSYKVTKNDGPILDKQNAFLLDRSVYLEVTATVFNQEVFPALEKSIVQFLNASPALVRHRRERQKFYQDAIQEINSEIQAMDLVKEKIDAKTQATFLNPSDLYANSVQLAERRSLYEIKLEEVKTIHLLKGFDSLTVNAKLPLLFAGMIGFAVGFAVLCLLLFIQFFSSFFKRYQRSH